MLETLLKEENRELLDRFRATIRRTTLEALT